MTMNLTLLVKKSRNHFQQTSSRLPIPLILLMKFEIFLLMKMTLQLSSPMYNWMRLSACVLAKKASKEDCFNEICALNLKKDQLLKLPEIATTNQSFQFDGQLYKQTDGVTMGPLSANVFMCHLEEKLTLLSDGLIMMSHLY